MNALGQNKVQPGSVVQILKMHNATGGRLGWIGAFVLVEKVRKWGVQGFVHNITTHDKSDPMHVRLPWDHIEYVGEASLIPLWINHTKEGELNAPRDPQFTA